MQFIDLSHIITTGMPVYPGTASAVIELASTIPANGYVERHLSMVSHTGTHIDVPAHIFSDGKTLSDYSPDAFQGRALKFSFSEKQPLTVEAIQQRISRCGIPDFVLLSNGWDKFWGRPEYFGMFPLPGNGIFELFCSLGIKGIGIDAISIDPVGSIDLPHHRIVLSKQLIIIENLTGLNNLPATSFDFFCFPLNIASGDGSPVRAVARIA
jgi:kynurenine formamidase